MSEKLSQGQEKFGADERKWRDVGAGLSVLDLHEENGRRLQLARITPQGRIMAHKHRGAEVMYVVRGASRRRRRAPQGGRRAGLAAGLDAPRDWSAEGCELVIECSPDDDLLRS